MKGLFFRFGQLQYQPVQPQILTGKHLLTEQAAYAIHGRYWHYDVSIWYFVKNNQRHGRILLLTFLYSQDILQLDARKKPIEDQVMYTTQARTPLMAVQSSTLNALTVEHLLASSFLLFAFLLLCT